MNRGMPIASPTHLMTRGLSPLLQEVPAPPQVLASSEEILSPQGLGWTLASPTRCITLLGRVSVAQVNPLPC